MPTHSSIPRAVLESCSSAGATFGGLRGSRMPAEVTEGDCLRREVPVNSTECRLPMAAPPAGCHRDLSIPVD